MKAKLLAIATAIYNKLGDPRTKNLMIVVLMILTAFGMIAPETATNLRNAVLSLAL